MQSSGVESVPFSEVNPPVTIQTKMKKINWGLEDRYETVCAKAPASLNPISDAQEIKLCPYGYAKLRMTELPVID